ncbi:MAG TPA: hypothetical protein VMF13_04470 [Luteitalea sp.]|nr:hypothetical protein [Luteitalea sp.]
MRVRWVSVVVGVWLVLMLSQAAPRNTGDSSEYLGMAMQFAAGRPPSFTEGELRGMRTASGMPEAGFELETRRFQEIRGADGRYEMPHMWVYSLLATPAVWGARLLRAAPVWGLVATNVALLAGLLALIVWRGGRAWAFAVVVTPLVWWVDKPLAEVMMACGLGAAALLFPTHGGAALVVLGLLAAQNPALLVACVVFGVLAFVQNPRRLHDWRWMTAAAIGALFAAVAPTYYLWRLGRLSPLTSYAEAALPSASALLYPLIDVNMGLFVRFPPALLLVLVPLARRDGWRMSAAWPCALTATALLLVCSQQPNMNQGGNPDLSRYAMWLLPLMLPWLLSLDAASVAQRAAGIAVLVLCAAWTTVAFPLTRPESYRYPTALATWLWTQHPMWARPRPETFAERTSHREPAVVPSATSTCEKVLLYEGRWPAACPPSYAEVPERCSAPGMFCYANRYGHGMHLVQPFGTVSGYRPESHDRTWRAGDETAAWVAGFVRNMASGSPPDTRLSIRAVSQVAWTHTWWSGARGRLVIYARGVGSGARIVFRHAAPATVVVRVPGESEPASRTTANEGLTVVAIPSRSHVVVDVFVD